MYVLQVCLLDVVVHYSYLKNLPSQFAKDVKFLFSSTPNICYCTVMMIMTPYNNGVTIQGE